MSGVAKYFSFCVEFSVLLCYFFIRKKESIEKKQILLFLQSLWFSGVCFGRTDGRLPFMRSFLKSG